MGEAVNSLLIWVVTLLQELITLNVNNLYISDMWGNATTATVTNVEITSAGATVTKSGAVMSVLGSMLSHVAVSLTTIYFLIELNRKMVFEGNDVTLKTFSAPFIKYAAAIGIISQYNSICSAMASAHDSFLTAIYNAVYSDTTATNTMLEAFGDAKNNLTGTLGFFLLFIILFLLILSSIVALVVKFVYWYKSLGYRLEVLFRIGLTPIACADVYSGQNSNAVRWLKAFLGTILYGSAFIIIPTLCFHLNDSIVAGMIKETNGLESLGVTDGMTAKQIAELVLGIETGTGADSISPFTKVMAIIKMILGSLIAPIAGIGALSAVRQAIKEAVG